MTHCHSLQPWHKGLSRSQKSGLIEWCCVTPIGAFSFARQLSLCCCDRNNAANAQSNGGPSARKNPDSHDAIKTKGWVTVELRNFFEDRLSPPFCAVIVDARIYFLIGRLRSFLGNNGCRGEFFSVVMRALKWLDDRHSKGWQRRRQRILKWNVIGSVSCRGDSKNNDLTRSYIGLIQL